MSSNGWFWLFLSSSLKTIQVKRSIANIAGSEINIKSLIFAFLEIFLRA